MAGNIKKLRFLTGLKRSLFTPVSLPVTSAFRLNSGTSREGVFQRNFTTTHICRLKEVSVTETENTIVVEGNYVNSPRGNSVANLPKNHSSCNECPLCRLGLTVRHTDVLIINQFINSKGKQLPRKVTGLCKDQHRRMNYLIVMAEKAGLIDREVERVVMHNGKVLYQPDEWEDPHFHKYYDESVIEEFLYSKRKRHI